MLAAYILTVLAQQDHTNSSAIGSKGSDISQTTEIFQLLTRTDSHCNTQLTNY